METALATRLELGEPIRCTDGELGELADIVLDPRSQRVTHLVARTPQDMGRKRLVPYELVHVGATENTIRLDCSVADAHRLAQAQEMTYLRMGETAQEDPEWDVGVQDVYPVPHYDAGAFVDYQPDPEPEILQTYDRIPKGHVEIRRESTISTGDGHSAGTLAGVLVQGESVTHLILRRGHFWQRRAVMVPVAEVQSIRTDEVILRRSRRELGDLPRCL